MTSFLNDVRFGLKMLARKPGFTLVAATALALGIGANTTIFSLVNALLIRPIPVENQDELVDIHHVFRDGTGFHSFSFPAYRDYRDRNRTLSGVASWTLTQVSVNVRGGAERELGIIVSGNYFDVLGVQPSLGRFFVPEEDRTVGTHPVAVLSHGYWLRRFGGDSSVIGREITVNSHPYTVVGVAGPGFTGIWRGIAPAIWVPNAMVDRLQPMGGHVVERDSEPPGWLDNRHSSSLEMFGRLRNGITMRQAESDLDGIARQLKKEFPDASGGEEVELAEVSAVPGQIKEEITRLTTH